MTADEREAEIKRLSAYLHELLEEVQSLRSRITWRHEECADVQAEIAALIAQRTPAEVEQMERERGLR